MAFKDSDLRPDTSSKPTADECKISQLGTIHEKDNDQVNLPTEEALQFGLVSQSLDNNSRQICAIPRVHPFLELESQQPRPCRTNS